MTPPNSRFEFAEFCVSNDVMAANIERRFNTFPKHQQSWLSNAPCVSHLKKHVGVEFVQQAKNSSRSFDSISNFAHDVTEKRVMVLEPLTD